MPRGVACRGGGGDAAAPRRLRWHAHARDVLRGCGGPGPAGGDRVRPRCCPGGGAQRGARALVGAPPGGRDRRARPPLRTAGARRPRRRPSRARGGGGPVGGPAPAGGGRPCGVRGGGEHRCGDHGAPAVSRTGVRDAPARARRGPLGGGRGAARAAPRRGGRDGRPARRAPPGERPGTPPGRCPAARPGREPDRAGTPAPGMGAPRCDHAGGVPDLQRARPHGAGPLRRQRGRVGRGR